jgi:hypothetical protein
MDCPPLGKIPPFFNELVLKATTSGVTFLKQNKYSSRYTGNKYSAVGVNGELHVNGALYRKEQRRLLEGREKKRGRQKPTPEKKVPNGPQISETFPTTDTDLSPQDSELPTSCKQYTVNKRLVRSRVLGYINTMKGKKELYFWTVSFPAGTPDDKCYQIYNIWLTTLRKYRMLKEYIWIAERQDGKRNDFKSATNTIHFHIAIPHRMDVHRANAMMQGTLKTFARRGEIPFSVHQCKRYNGVDIDKNRKTRRVINFALKKSARSLASYLTKYITKNEGGFSHLASTRRAGRRTPAPRRLRIRRSPRR